MFNKKISYICIDKYMEEVKFIETRGFYNKVNNMNLKNSKVRK